MTNEDLPDLTFAMWISIAVATLMLTAAIITTSGCTGASAQLRTAYSTEVARCVMNERAIVDREGTTREQDESDLTLERARCDAALAEIEHGGGQ